MDEATRRALLEAQGQLDELAADMGYSNSTEAALEIGAKRLAQQRYGKPVGALKLAQREQVYRLAAEEIGYGSSRNGMAYQPQWDAGENASDMLQREAGRVAAARGRVLEDLDPENDSDVLERQRIYDIAAKNLAYRGASE